MREPVEITLKDGRRARIRPATVDDAAKTIALDRVLAEDGRGMVLTPDQTRSLEEEQKRLRTVWERIEKGNATLPVVAEIVGDESAGIVASAQIDAFGQAYCKHVAALMIGIHPNAQGQGLGRAVMQHLIDHGRARGLERLELYVRADNPRARSLYSSLGFVHEATRARFVKLPDGTYVDDHVMCLFLTN